MELHADYTAAGFSRRLGWGSRPALLLVDPVAAYTLPGSPLFLDTAQAAVAAMAALLGTARGSGLPVVLTGVRYADATCSEAPLFAAKVPALAAFAAGSPLGEFPPELAPAPGEHVVHKHYASAFAGTSLPAWLTANGVDTLVIGGFSTSGCVRASAVDALQHGFRPMVVREACADRDPGPHDANLFDLDAKYADVVPLAEALTRLS
ncbi:isochorismatase family protein [Catellatospora bangladeshensis]|uniref:N-carbamoylsarcosine amidase n=1 Tax=Catellatospora bangladeshensis TaxID=310355 RepID=A0A8J3K0M1_9ACTN|nr:isochorismatase family protein [Catellatospora bangladeshensis]GIF86424.1 N-carbamoylsarcosine amidase [Catellatospora bangladeshensis]